MARFESVFGPYHRWGRRRLRLQTPYGRGTDVALFHGLYNAAIQWTAPAKGPMGTPIVMDGIFGPQTADAVRTVQTYFGATVTGIVDCYGQV